MPSLSLILPTYNERENIRFLIPRLMQVFSAYDYEILVVDDDSPDGTGRIVEAMALSDKRVRLITKPREGIGAALRVGYDQAKGEILASMDADLSFGPVSLLRTVHAVERGADLVVGSRHTATNFYEASTGRVKVKRWISRHGNQALRLVFGVPIHDFTANCRAIKRSVWQALKTTENTNTLLLEMILLAHFSGYTVRETPVIFSERQHGVSKLRLGKEIPKMLLKTLAYAWEYRVRR